MITSLSKKWIRNLGSTDPLEYKGRPRADENVVFN